MIRQFIMSRSKLKILNSFYFTKLKMSGNVRIRNGVDRINAAGHHSESSRTPQCSGALGCSEDLLLPSWATGTLLILGKVLQHLALLPTDKSPWFRFVVPSPCPVSVVRGQFKEPPAPALVFSPNSRQPGRLFPGMQWSHEGQPPFVLFHLGVLLPWKEKSHGFCGWCFALLCAFSFLTELAKFSILFFFSEKQWTEPSTSLQ